VHRHRCRDFAIKIVQDAIFESSLSGTDARIIPNCTRLAAKRTEGLKQILVRSIPRLPSFIILTTLNSRAGFLIQFIEVIPASIYGTHA